MVCALYLQLVLSNLVASAIYHCFRNKIFLSLSLIETCICMHTYEHAYKLTHTNAHARAHTRTHKHTPSTQSHFPLLQATPAGSDLDLDREGDGQGGGVFHVMPDDGSHLVDVGV